MRVIAGRFKGRKLLPVERSSVRPATDRVKQVIFDILSTRINLGGAEVLDLYAGTGSLGIEALSRGAIHCCFVDTDRAAVDCITKNLTTFGCQQSATVVRRNADRFLDHPGKQFDLIFADPPYAHQSTQEIPLKIFSGGFLQKTGYVVMEHTRNISFARSELFQMDVEKTFGSTLVTFLSHRIS